VLIVARRAASVREEEVDMPRARDVHAPSRARCQAKSALTRGRRTKKTGQHAGEIPGQLSIYDALADIAAEQAAEGGEQS